MGASTARPFEYSVAAQLDSFRFFEYIPSLDISGAYHPIFDECLTLVSHVYLIGLKMQVVIS